MMCSFADAQKFGRESFRVANGDVTDWEVRFNSEFQDKATCVLLPALPLNDMWRVASSHGPDCDLTLIVIYYTASVTKRQ